jgi:hypothetical protein
MIKRILAISFIFLATAFAWAVLGATIFARTYSARGGLQNRVVSTWGAAQQQTPPSATYCVSRAARALPLESSRLRVALDLDPRRKGLLWYSTYRAAFAGSYVFRNPTGEVQDVDFTLRFPVARAVYDDLVITVDGARLPIISEEGAARVRASVAPGGTASLAVSYRSQGLDSWRYSFGKDVSQVRDFQLAMTTNFAAIDFPDNTLSPSERRPAGGGWELKWAYNNLVTGVAIGMDMPQKLQPGPLAGEISYFAPVSLLFFFFLVFVITTLRGIDLHPMNYFFLACAFFAFHLLLAYLVDHLAIHAAFAICSAVSIALVVSYLRLVAGLRFAALEAGLAQFIYLVLFSYAFFLEGFTGLAITIGAILTLFVVMQMTGRIRWGERFAAPAPPPPPPRPA